MENQKTTSNLPVTNIVRQQPINPVDNQPPTPKHQLHWVTKKYVLKVVQGFPAELD